MPHSMKLDDVADREVIGICADCAGVNGDGTFTTADVAATMDLDTKHPLSNVGVRLAYLRRIGLLERDDSKAWRISRVGERYLSGALTKVQQRALESLRSEGAAWAATESLSAVLRTATPTEQTMMRRQWQHGWAQRTR